MSFFYKLINSERIKAFLALSLFSFPLVNCYYEEHTASIEGGYTTWAIESENSQCIPINANGFWARRGNQKLRWYGNECFAQKNLNIGVSIADEWNVITEKNTFMKSNLTTMLILQRSIVKRHLYVKLMILLQS